MDAIESLQNSFSFWDRAHRRCSQVSLQRLVPLSFGLKYLIRWLRRTQILDSFREVLYCNYIAIKEVIIFHKPQLLHILKSIPNKRLSILNKCLDHR